MAEMKVYQREHFQKKIRDLLRPEIEKEERTILDVKNKKRKQNVI